MHGLRRAVNEWREGVKDGSIVTCLTRKTYVKTEQVVEPLSRRTVRANFHRGEKRNARWPPIDTAGREMSATTHTTTVVDRRREKESMKKKTNEESSSLYSTGRLSFLIFRPRRYTSVQQVQGSKTKRNKANARPTVQLRATYRDGSDRSSLPPATSHPLGTMPRPRRRIRAETSRRGI